MEIKGFSQIMDGHGRAFDVPAWTAFAPWAVPGRFSWFCCLPESKVSWISLFIIHFNTGTSQHIFNLSARQFTIMFKGGNIVIYISAQYIGMMSVNQSLYHFNDIIHMFRNAWIDICTAHMESIHDIEISINVAVGNGLPVAAFSIGFVDNLIIHVGKILNEGYFISDIFEIAADDIPGHCRTGIADMGMVIRSDSAYIDLCFPWYQWFEFFFFFCKGVVYSDFFHLQSSIYELFYVQKTAG